MSKVAIRPPFIVLFLLAILPPSNLWYSFVAFRGSEQQLQVSHHRNAPGRLPSGSGEGVAEHDNVRHVLPFFGRTPGGGLDHPLVSPVCVSSDIRGVRVDRVRPPGSFRGGRRLGRTPLPRLGVVPPPAGPTGSASPTGSGPSSRRSCERETARGSDRGHRPHRPCGGRGGGEDSDPSSPAPLALTGDPCPGPFSL